MKTKQLVIVCTGAEDPMWPFLQERCTNDERQRLLLFCTDSPRNSQCSYDPAAGNGAMTIDGRRIDSEEVRGVWVRRFVPPKLTHLAQDLRLYCEAEYSDFFQGIEYLFPNAVWVSKPSAIEAARNKARQLMLAQSLGFSVPKTLFTNSPRDMTDFACKSPSIYKAVRSPRIPLGTERPTTVFTTALTDELLRHPEGLMSCPGILQRFVPKSADIRVTVFGERVFATLIDSQSVERSRVDFRRGAFHLQHNAHELPAEVAAQCMEIVCALGLKYGAIDLALQEDGSYMFFEVNPNGQWGWVEQKTGQPMRRALLDMLFA